MEAAARGWKLNSARDRSDAAAVTPGVYRRQKEKERKHGSRKVMGTQWDVTCPSRLCVTSMSRQHPHPRGSVASVNSLILSFYFLNFFSFCVLS